jgi:flagellar biosynthesis activator protein FlaF
MREQSTNAVFQRSFAEHVADNAAACRDRERLALERAIQLLCRAEAAGASSQEADDALDFAGRLWKAFVQDLGEPENDLPCVLKAEIISIGHWIINEAALIRRGKSRNFRGLIEICAIIRDGLR